MSTQYMLSKFMEIYKDDVLECQVCGWIDSNTSFAKCFACDCYVCKDCIHSASHGDRRCHLCECSSDSGSCGVEAQDSVNIESSKNE